ncbi:hypothetical protein WP12_00790 [Sphingomonas sp. SRS2]|nr:hypothetical protein WP12_00790 [Sphingomonas sp. SRS2]
MAISSSSIVVPGRDVVSCDLDGDAVLLDLDRSRYFKLNRVGAHIWTELGNRATVGDLRRSVMESFDVDPDRCVRDIDNLLSALSASGLIKIDDVPAA